VEDSSPKSRNKDPGCGGEHSEASETGLADSAYIPSDRWDHVLFYQKYMRLKDASLSRSREHVGLLQVHSRPAGQLPWSWLRCQKSAAAR